MLRKLMMALLAVVLGSVCLGSSARAERRVALVIGNAAYAHAATLRNPRNDASDMADALRKVGFEVVLGLDLDQQRFAATVQQFAQMLDDADVALFYYAGHGLQIGGKNYLVSVNALLNNEFLISSETIELDAIVHLMESKVPMNLVFLDACRNNPLAENLKRNLVAMRRGSELGRGLARIEPTGRDTLIAFAAAPGQEAADGTSRNSPFTAALLKNVTRPNLEVSVMLKLVSAEVRENTNNAQRPQQLSDMSRTFYFTRSRDEVAALTTSAPPKENSVSSSPRAGTAVQSTDSAVDMAFWAAARSANDCEAIRAYMQRFPSGIFIELARLSERRLCAASGDRHVTILQGVPSQQPSGNPPAPVAQPPAATLPIIPQMPAKAVEKPALVPSPAQKDPATALPPGLASKPEPPPQSNAAAANPQEGANAFFPSLSSSPSPVPVQQQALSIRPPTAPVQTPPNSFKDCADCPEMIKLPASRFEMGSRDDRTESPVHEVTVAAFAIGKYPVTLREWRKCVAAQACYFSPDGDDDLPVYGISWNDAQEYVKWLSRVGGAQYRLPSEAEWEYAARGNTRTKFYWGDSLQPSEAACKGCGTDFRVNRPMKVGAMPANPFGLYDLNGTVSQWVADCWHKDYKGAPTNASPWLEKDRECSQRVLRGGAWNNDASYLRTSSRDFYDASVRYETHGLRVARDVENGR